MADQRVLDVGNACILACPQFIDGHIYGWLLFYDENHRPIFPLTSDTVCEYLMDIISDPQKPDSWKMGAVAGWSRRFARTARRPLRACLQVSM